MSELRESNNLFFTVHHAESFIHEMGSRINLVSKSVNNKFLVWLHVQQLQKKILPTWLLNFSIWHLMTGSDLVNDLKKKPSGIPRIINQFEIFTKVFWKKANANNFCPVVKRLPGHGAWKIFYLMEITHISFLTFGLALFLSQSNFKHTMSFLFFGIQLRTTALFCLLLLFHGEMSGINTIIIHVVCSKQYLLLLFS